MKAKKILKALNKALKEFEKECNNSGKLIEGVDISFSYKYVTFKAVIEDNVTGDDFIMTQDLWFYNGEIEADSVQIFNY